MVNIPLFQLQHVHYMAKLKTFVSHFFFYQEHDMTFGFNSEGQYVFIFNPISFKNHKENVARFWSFLCRCWKAIMVRFGAIGEWNNALNQKRLIFFLKRKQFYYQSTRVTNDTFLRTSYAIPSAKAFYDTIFWVVATNRCSSVDNLLEHFDNGNIVN